MIPGKSALLSQERDIASLADNISYLLKNQDIWEEMGREGRRFVEEYHDINKEIDLLEERYDRLLRRDSMLPNPDVNKARKECLRE